MIDIVLNGALPTPQQDKTTSRHGTLGTAANLEMLARYNMSNSKRGKRSSRVEPDWFRILQEFNCDQISHNNNFNILIYPFTITLFFLSIRCKQQESSFQTLFMSLFENMPSLMMQQIDPMTESKQQQPDKKNEREESGGVSISVHSHLLVFLRCQDAELWAHISLVPSKQCQRNILSATKT